MPAGAEDKTANYTAYQIAQYFIWKDFVDPKNLTHLKLQKLLYLAQGWYLAYTGKQLFSDRIFAWKFGPVIKDIYHIYKHRGNSELKMSYQNFSEPNYISLEVKQFLNKIWDSYAKFDAIVLSELTHIKGSPWSETIRENAGSLDNLENDVEIPLNRIQMYFRNQLPQQVA